MPQKFQVIRCYACGTFQSHEIKKSNKWECRLCGKKQSFKRYYGLGTAKECRFQVIKLNGMRGQLENTESHTDQDSDSSKDEETDWTIEPVKVTDEPIRKTTWSQYLEEQGPIKINTNTNSPGDEEVGLEIPNKQSKLNTESVNTNPTISTMEVSTDEPKALDNLVKTESTPLEPSLNSEVYHPEETFNNIKPNNMFVPIVIKKSTSPDLTEQTSLNSEVYHPEETFNDIKPKNMFVPIVIKKSTSPDLTEQTGLNSEVYHPEETFNNIKPKNMFVPIVIKKSTSPDLTEQTGLNSEVYRPEETFNDIKPNMFVPIVIKKSTSPDLSDQTSLLPPFENLDGLCSDSQMTKPFTWREDTNDLEALNI